MTSAPRAFVVGHPIKHSRSPLIHGHWLREHGLAGAYERIDVPPQEFASFLRSLDQRGYVGGNVTLPHKEAAFELVTRRTERAERLQAVNTIWLEDGVLWGDNTDVTGFMAHLDQTLGSGWEQNVGTALVLGAGGASRAIVAGLLERAIDRIYVSNRTLEKARQLTALDPRRVEALPWNSIPEALPISGLVVNTTSLGMVGQPALTIDLAPARADAIVADIVYVPLRTALLAAAEERGLRTVDGLGMLLHQAVPGFARWFGIMPQVTPELRALVVADIEERS